MENENIILDGKQVTKEVLQEEMNKTPAAEKIVEVSEGNFKTLKRMNG